MFKREYIKKISAGIISLLIILLILTVLIPPATSVYLSTGSIPSQPTTIGNTITFQNVNLTIRGEERIPISYLNFSIFNEANDACVAYIRFTVEGVELSDLPTGKLTVTKKTTIPDNWYCYGYGYGYDEQAGQPYCFDYGYGYGYGDNSYTDITILYDITYTTHQTGTFYTKLYVNSTSDSTNHLYESNPSATFQIRSIQSGGGTVVTNSPPTANANGPYHAMIDKTVFFDGSKSIDSDGTIVSYSWMFGDGSTSMEMSPAYIYTTQGVYTVMLTVTDNKGATDIDTTTATIISDTVEVSNTMKKYIEELYNISLPERFYTIDTNGDGSLDTFTDPNNILESIRFVNYEENDMILISVKGDPDQLFIWDTTNDSNITPVKHSIGAILSDDIDTSSNTITVTIEVDKANWTYFQIPDVYPELSKFIIQTDDGRIISDEYIWRENNTIFVLDDPSIIYEIIYTRFLFDISLTLTKDTIEVDEQLEALIELINVGTPGLVNATISYSILKDDTIIWSEHQDLTVSAQLAFTKMISTIGLAPGSYTLQVVHTYGIDQTAEAQATFTIQEPSGGIPWIILIIALIIALGVAFYYLYKKGYIIIER